jgi:DNA-binding LacI/PurR family transcriptional regulator
LARCRRELDGLSASAGQRREKLVAAARRRHMPTVIVDSPAIVDIPESAAGGPARAADFVGIDDAGAAEAAMRHLLDLGHRRLAIISLPLSAEARAGRVELAQDIPGTASVPIPPAGVRPGARGGGDRSG